MPKIIWTGDWHLTQDKPRCRIDDDWEGFLDNLLKYVVRQANDRDAYLVIGGDIFGRRSPNVSNSILNIFIRNVMGVYNGTRILAGNHDEYFHNFDLIHKTSFGILDSFITSANIKKLSYIDDLGCWKHFNGKIKNPNSELVFIHRLTFENKKTMPPNVEATTADGLLKEFPQAKYIFTSDMHRSFLYEKNGRYVCNAGSLYRGSADQVLYSPCVYFVDTDKTKIEKILLPDTDKMVVDSYIIEGKEKDDRISAFVEGLNNTNDMTFDFIGNIEMAIKKNKIDNDLRAVIIELCDKEVN